MKYLAAMWLLSGLVALVISIWGLATTFDTKNDPPIWACKYAIGWATFHIVLSPFLVAIIIIAILFR